MTIQLLSEDIGGQMDELERLEPWESERMMGVQLPMNGDMTHEFKHRVRQIDTMATKLYKPLFSFQDTEVVYQARYKAAIRHPVSSSCHLIS